MLTVQYAKGLSNMQINPVDLGATNTGSNFKNGIQTLEKDVRVIIKMVKVEKVVQLQLSVIKMELSRGN